MWLQGGVRAPLTCRLTVRQNVAAIAPLLDEGVPTPQRKRATRQPAVRVPPRPVRVPPRPARAAPPAPPRAPRESAATGRWRDHKTATTRRRAPGANQELRWAVARRPFRSARTSPGADDVLARADRDTRLWGRTRNTRAPASGPDRWSFFRPGLRRASTCSSAR